MKRLWWVVAGVSLLLAAGLAWWFMQPRAALTIQNQQFIIEVAKSTEELQTGLSGRTSLAPNHGMLFVFDKDDTWGIWMKDMRIPLDIVWLNAEKRVVHIEANVQPDNYPAIFTPDQPARYVLEVNAGTVEGYGIGLGDVASFDVGQ